LEVLQFGRVLRRWGRLIIGFALIAGITAAVVSYELPRTYEATTVALVNPKQVLLPADAGASALSTDALVQTYSRLIGATPVYQKLIAGGVPRTEEELINGVSAKVEPNTTLIDITIKDRDPAMTQRIAEEIIPAFNASLRELQNKVATPDVTAAKLEALVPWQVPSHAPTSPVSPKPLLNVLFALVAGTALGIGIAFLLEYLDNTIKSELDVRIQLNQALLGPVLYKHVKRRGRRVESEEDIALVAIREPHDPMSEAYRAIRTNLMFASTDTRLKSLVVTSAIPGEGKSSTACNLAVVMAQAGNKVILVDADFRRPQLHKIFHRSNVGLGNLILGDRAEVDLIVKTQVDNLSIVCSGPTPPNPSELLGSIRMQGVLDRLKSIADVVIFDTPPVGALTDATILAARTDGVVLVVERGRTDVHSVTKALDTLKAVRANVLGVVLNKMQASKGSEYYYYRYHTETPRGKAGSNGRDWAAKRDAPAGLPLSNGPQRAMAPEIRTPEIRSPQDATLAAPSDSSPPAEGLGSTMRATANDHAPGSTSFPSPRSGPLEQDPSPGRSAPPILGPSSTD
jgi:polysaccharide biosynthesis transport protein